jgi:2-oxoisovalerate dehydrogenase E1 component
MSPFVDDPARHVLSPNVPVGNNALAAVGVAAEVKARAGRPIVVCSMGDGTTQQGEVLEAIGEAVRAELPVLFVVEDNRYAISTPTAGRTFFSPPDWCGPAPLAFLGLPIHRLDGRDALALREGLGPVVRSVRESRRPALVVVRCDRLSNHSHADDQRVYRPAGELEHARATGDPLRILRRRLIDAGVTAVELDRIDGEVDASIRRAAESPWPSTTPPPNRPRRPPCPTASRGRRPNTSGATSRPVPG